MSQQSHNLRGHVELNGIYRVFHSDFFVRSSRVAPPYPGSFGNGPKTAQRVDHPPRSGGCECKTTATRYRSQHCEQSFQKHTWECPADYRWRVHKIKSQSKATHCRARCRPLGSCSYRMKPSGSPRVLFVRIHERR